MSRQITAEDAAAADKIICLSPRTRRRF
ncbi:MAG: hypothetical protein ACLR56_00215 [Oscillospiraceae bacterium]